MVNLRYFIKSFRPSKSVPTISLIITVITFIDLYQEFHEQTKQVNCFIPQLEKGWTNESDSGKSERRRSFPSNAREKRCNQCNPFIYERILGTDKCRASVKLLILVTTIPAEFDIRSLIRKTWGRATSTVRTVFLLGNGWAEDEQRSIINESQLYQDIIQYDYIDSYYNLTLKVLSGFHWWHAYCPAVKYLLRTAGDNFINVQSLLKVLYQMKDDTCRILGKCKQKSGPIRSAGRKWYVSLFEYKARVYPPYCVGSAYAMNSRTTRALLQTSPNVPYFPMEDVYIGLVMQQAFPGKRTTATIPGFHIEFQDFNQTSCSQARKWISIHGVGKVEFTLIQQRCFLTK